MPSTRVIFGMLEGEKDIFGRAKGEKNSHGKFAAIFIRRRIIRQHGLIDDVAAHSAMEIMIGEDFFLNLHLTMFLPTLEVTFQN